MIDTLKKNLIRKKNEDLLKNKYFKLSRAREKSTKKVNFNFVIYKEKKIVTIFISLPRREERGRKKSEKKFITCHLIRKCTQPCYTTGLDFKLGLVQICR